MTKQLTSMLCSLLLFALLLGTLTGCKLTQAERKLTQAEQLNRMEESERAFALMELINANGEASDSYTFDMEVDLKGVIQGIDMEVSSESKMLFAGLTGDLPLYRSDLTTRVDAMEGQIKTTVKIQEGFQNGKMYRFYESDGYEQALWSPINWNDFVKYMDSKVDVIFDVQSDDCTKVTCVQQEDGNWTAAMKGFTEDGLKAFEGMTVDFENMFGEDYAIKDILFTFETNERFYLTSFTIDVTFESLDKKNQNDLPKMTFEATVCKYGSTKVDQVDLKKYTEVVDLRILELPGKTLEDFVDGEEGVLQFRIDQCIQLSTYKKKLIERDKISFTNKDGKYTYRVETEQGGNDILMTYADGVSKTVVKQGSTVKSEDEEKSTDKEAKAFIEGLVMQSAFDANQITDIELKDGVYIFHMRPEGNALLKRMMDSAGSDELGNVRKVNYTATIKNEKLIKLEFLIDANIVTEQGLLRVDLSIVYDFKAR